MLKQVSLATSEVVTLTEVAEEDPIFAKRGGVLRGMVVQELSGWILKTGGLTGAYGYYKSRTECLKRGLTLNYKFFVDSAN